MLDRYLSNLGLTEKAISAKELNGKFIAILRNIGNSGDPEIIRISEETVIRSASGTTKLAPGDILAHENPIEIQEIAERLYPEKGGDNNRGGRYIQFCHIPENLSVF